MATTTFSGPVVSNNGFTGDVTGDVTAATLSATTSTTTVALTASGAVIFSGLPTSDPTVEGQLWNNLGVLTVSAG